MDKLIVSQTVNTKTTAEIEMANPVTPMIKLSINRHGDNFIQYIPLILLWDMIKFFLLDLAFDKNDMTGLTRRIEEARRAAGDYEDE